MKRILSFTPFPVEISVATIYELTFALRLPQRRVSVYDVVVEAVPVGGRLGGRRQEVRPDAHLDETVRREEALRARQLRAQRSRHAVRPHQA